MANYSVIGADGVQRGPVPADDVRRWVAEGRLDLKSKVQAEGTTEWVALGSVSELAASMATSAPPPLPSGAPAQSRMSTMAILSLVFGPLGLFTCGISSLVGLVLGIIALIKISNSKGALRGSGLAIAGICCSVVMFLVLPAMLLPALVAAKGKAMTINCINNERQLVLQLKMYASQHNDQYPPADTWCDAISGSVTPKLFTCPAATPNSRCDYAFNDKLGGLNQTKVSADTVILFESDGGWNAHGGPELMVGKSRHTRIFNVTFADGHSEEMTIERLNTLRWDP